MSIVVLNQSTVVSDNDCAAMAAACGAQIAYHAAPVWRRRSPGMRFVPVTHKLTSNEQPIYIFDDADQAGALGYHDETPEGLPYARVFAKVSLDNGVSVSSVLSHEALEMFGDPFINLWASAPDGNDYAVELCDAVESDSYIMPGTNVEVSNFVLPEWFDESPSSKKFDWLGKLTAPFSMTPGGYVLFKTTDGVQQAFGAHYPQWRKETKLHSAARTAKRGILYVSRSV